MTTLHYLLIGLAVLLVAGVMLYNFLQERRLRKQIDGMFERGLDASGRATLPAAEAEPATDTVQARTPLAVVADDTPDGAPAQTAPLAGEAEADTYDEMITLMRRSAQDSEDDGLPLPTLHEDDLDKPVSTHQVGPSPEPPPMLDMRGASKVMERPPEAPAPEAPRRVVPTVNFEPSPLDDTVECIARVRLGERAVASYAGLLDALRRIGKPARAFVQDEAGRWRPLSATPGADIAIEAGVQWVDRQGALSEAQYEAFCRTLYDFVADHGGAATCPERAEALRQARELDAFCVEVDMLIGLNLVAPEGMPFSGRRVDDLARQAGLVPDGRGGYAQRGADGQAQFTLVNRDNSAIDAGATTPAVTLLFDVPNVENGLAVFDRMTELGFAMARGLGGRMVDDRGHPVSDASLSKDREQLSRFYARMRAQGIPAGGERARRLFA